jgi:hypothetical protein
MPYRSPAPYLPYQPRSGDRIADLIMEQGRVRSEGLRRSGDIAAQQAAASGQIWGGAVANLGNVAAGALQQHAERQEQSKRSKAFEAALQSGDPKLILRTLGPRDGPAVVRALAAHAPNGMKQYSDRMELLRDQARGVLAVPPENRAAAYKFAVEGLIANGVIKPEEAPPAYDETVLKQLASYGSEPAKAEGLHNVPPGTTVLDPTTRRPVFTAPAAPVKPPEPPNFGSFEDYTIRYAAEKGKTPQQLSPRDIEDARKRYNQSDDRPRISVNMPGSGMSPTAEAAVIQRLSQQWEKAAAPAVELNRQVKIMDVGLQAARRGDINQGSQAVLVTFQKILDSLSVVREAEYLRSAQGMSLIARINGAMEKLRVGGTGVSVSELEKFASMARQMAKEQSTGYLDAVKSRLGQTADRYKIPKELVFTEFDFGKPTETTKKANPFR